MFCCTLPYFHSSFAIILMRERERERERECERELVALLSLSFWSVALPRGARGLSAVCDCGIS